MGQIRVRLVVGLALALLVALFAVVSFSTQRPGRAVHTAESGCADVLLVLVPGNGEGTADLPGSTLDRIRQSFLRSTSGTRTTSVKVVRSSTRTSADLAQRFPNRPANQVILRSQVRTWEAGINVATSRVKALLDQAMRICPNQSFVLGGYSQGAGSVHRVLAGTPVTSARGRRIVGAIVVGDPDRAPDTRATRMGRKPAPVAISGIEYARRVRIADVPLRGSVSQVLSVCRRGDLVCSFGGQTVRAGVAFHNSYAGANIDQLESSAGTLAARVRAIPLPQVGTFPVSATVGALSNTQVPVDVSPAYRSRLRFDAVTAMPAGLRLSAAGRVEGEPVNQGTTTVRYRVRNLASSAYARPILGHLRITVHPSEGVQSSSGGDSTCVINPQRQMYCWGANDQGQLGDGTRTSRTSPKRMGTGSTWVAVSTGATHTCGIRASGTLWCWGQSGYGQIGDGTSSDRLRPVQVGSFATWSAVSTSWASTCGVTRTGALWCWGNNRWGQLGIGSTTTYKRPRHVGTSLWTSVTAGGWHTCGVRRGGTLWCWGANDFGQLGIGNTEQRNVPTRVGTASDWVRASAGYMHSCGFQLTGVASCWGSDVTGQLGDASNVSKSKPSAVRGANSWVDIVAGDQFTCGVLASGSGWCWGTGMVGQLGAGSPTSSTKPLALPGGPWRTVTAGWAHACGVVRGSGRTRCWGFNSRGQVGDGSTVTSRVPIPVPVP